MERLTVGTVLVEHLRARGVARVHGSPLGDLHHVPVDEVELAVLLADADGRLGHHDGSGRLGAALLDGPLLHLSSEPGGTTPVRTVTTVEEVLDALADPPGMEIPGTSALHLDLDLDEPLTSVPAAPGPPRRPVTVLDPAMSELSIVAVVGPGVVRTGSVDGLSHFARTAGVGVLNSWGAKGVERWDSPFHLGTAGLQRRDLELAGIAEADVVVVAGLDPDEISLSDLGDAVVQDVPATHLGALCHRWTPSRAAPDRRPLYERLAAVVTPMYESDRVPLTAPRAALHLSGALPDRGVAVADPGPAGFWIARTAPTSHPGSVCVPATAVDGFAAAAALVCSLEGRPCLAVTDQRGDDGVDPTTEAVLELAESLGASLGLQLWGPRGDLGSSTEHVDLLRSHLEADGVRVRDVPVDLDDTTGLEEVAGELVAWSGGRG